MAPDTGPNENANQNEEYLNNAPPYNFPNPSSDEDDMEDFDYVGNDDDSDVGDNMGYQLLDQEGDDVGNTCSPINSVENIDSENQHEWQSCNSSTDMVSSFPINSLLLPSPKDDSDEEPRSDSRPDRIQLDQDKIDQIKQAMSGFSLPPSCFPGWAPAVTEEQLTDFIRYKTKSK